MRLKITALIVAFFVLFGIMPSFAAVVATNDGIEYQIDDSGCSITGYHGKASDIVIPSEIDGYPVTEIRSYAFSDNTRIKSVVISDGIKSIGDSAFRAALRSNQ